MFISHKGTFVTKLGHHAAISTTCSTWYCMWKLAIIIFHQSRLWWVWLYPPFDDNNIVVVLTHHLTNYKR